MKKMIRTTITMLAAFGFIASLQADETKAEELKADVEVTISGNDQMQFDVKEVQAEAGQVVKITFKNVGQLPKVAMGHNLVVLKPGTDVPGFAMKAITATDHEYIPQEEELKSAVIASTKILGPGEEEAITFKVEASGEYPFVCTFPGHFGIMNGKIIVK